MPLTEKLMEIEALIHSEGGAGFLKIRAHLEDVDRLAKEPDPLAVKFSKSLDDVYRFLKIAVARDG